MANFNKVILIGNLTRDIEIRHTQGGSAVGKTGIAVNRKWRPQGDGELKEEVTFVDLTAFGKSAETLNEYVGKGSPIMIEGRLHYSTWEAKEGGKRSKLEVIVETFQFLGGKRDDDRPAGQKGQKAEATATIDDSEIPF
jgi:single-strand DNA-binding protein